MSAWSLGPLCKKQETTGSNQCVIMTWKIARNSFKMNSYFSLGIGLTEDIHTKGLEVYIKGRDYS